jgi:hemoglobin-like flavoprotein
VLSSSAKHALQSSFRLVKPIAETAADLFYGKLFELKPEYRVLFSSDMAAQKRKLMGMLAFIVRALDWPESSWRESTPAETDLFLVVLALGRRHTRLYKIPADSYEVVGKALLWTLDQGLGPAFTAEVRGAWAELYRLLCCTMRLGDGAEEENLPSLHEAVRGIHDNNAESIDCPKTETA